MAPLNEILPCSNICKILLFPSGHGLRGVSLLDGEPSVHRGRHLADLRWLHRHRHRGDCLRHRLRNQVELLELLA